MKCTSAEARKIVKKIEEEIKKIEITENKSSVFQVASQEDQESLRPAYNFLEMQNRITELEEKLRIVKHAINTFNTEHVVEGFDNMTIDQALVYMPQLKKRVAKLKGMSERLPKERVTYLNKNWIDYNIANYDISDAEAEYRRAYEDMAKLQLSLDLINTTEVMEIDIEI